MAATEQRVQDELGQEAAPKREAVASKTKYVVLRADDEDSGWSEVGDFESASDKEGALKKWVEALPESDRDGRFKAVAERSWKGGFKAGTRTEVRTEFEEID